MKIKVLGASGAESPGHNPPSLLLNDRILFDAGSLTHVLDLKDQLKIGDIFITHAHLDHITGIPFLAENIVFTKRKSPVRIFSIPPVVRAIKRHILNGSIWPDFSAIPNARHPILRLIELKTSHPIKIVDCSITPVEVNHSVPAVGYLVEDGRKRRFFYTGDTGPSKDLWGRLGERQLHCLIIEVSFPNRMERIAIQTGHLTPRLLKSELSKINWIPERILITHLKSKHARAIETELQKLRIKNVKLLRDEEIIKI
jgi:ribonuclease BN (tRNA processing enzyme)